ncbi:SRPBCC family protein [Rhizobium sp. NTR19]|uniref:SRPBCC family protein n=1 Tax=Neorhizobium turbinariae TaxID=2937795 RepID=A0ABT0IT71_9HYPH|nr:SRPBCC family protein [Neorhizobium turbinariae]MCK8781053.1 SRPBCC family protein [Neorhizobium turbinariae]
MATYQARIIHVSIDRPWQEVYAYASKPENMQYWASGLAEGLRRDGDEWIGDGGPIGRIRVRFSPENPYGILDHTVAMEDGTVVGNPLRVVPNVDGAEVMFTLLKRPEMTEEAFEADAAHIQKDLMALKAILEGKA